MSVWAHTQHCNTLQQITRFHYLLFEWGHQRRTSVWEYCMWSSFVRTAYSISPVVRVNFFFLNIMKLVRCALHTNIACDQVWPKKKKEKVTKNIREEIVLTLMIGCVGTYCSTRCNTLEHITRLRYKKCARQFYIWWLYEWGHTATHCNTLQHWGLQKGATAQQC